MSLWLFLLSVTLLKISFLSFPSLLHIKIHFFLPGSCITHRLGKGTKCKLEESAEGSRKAAWEQHSDTKYRSERSLPLCAVILFSSSEFWASPGNIRGWGILPYLSIYCAFTWKQNIFHETLVKQWNAISIGLFLYYYHYLLHILGQFGLLFQNTK